MRVVKVFAIDAFNSMDTWIARKVSIGGNLKNVDGPYREQRRQQ